MCIRDRRWGAQRAQTMGNATSITAVLGGLTSPTDLADLERICGQRQVRRVSTHRGTGGRNGRDHSRLSLIHIFDPTQELHERNRDWLAQRDHMVAAVSPRQLAEAVLASPR